MSGLITPESLYLAEVHHYPGMVFSNDIRNVELGICLKFGEMIQN